MKLARQTILQCALAFLVAGGGPLFGFAYALADDSSIGRELSDKQATPIMNKELDEIQHRVADRNRVYRELFEEMSRKENKFAKAIKRIMRQKLF